MKEKRDNQSVLPFNSAATAIEINFSACLFSQKRSGLGDENAYEKERRKITRIDHFKQYNKRREEKRERERERERERTTCTDNLLRSGEKRHVADQCNDQHIKCFFRALLGQKLRRAHVRMYIRTSLRRAIVHKLPT